MSIKTPSEQKKIWRFMPSVCFDLDKLCGLASTDYSNVGKNRRVGWRWDWWIRLIQNSIGSQEPGSWCR